MGSFLPERPVALQTSLFNWQMVRANNTGANGGGLDLLRQKLVMALDRGHTEFLTELGFSKKTRERDVQYRVSVSRASAKADSDMHVRALYKTESAQCQVVRSFAGFAARSNELQLLRDTSGKSNSFLMHGTR